MNNLDIFREIKAFAFDFEGALAHPEMILQQEGNVLRKIHVQDRFAIHQALISGFPVAVISTWKTRGMGKVMKDLGISDYYFKGESKKDSLKDFISKYQIDPETLLYMASDHPDLEPMELAGLSCCPSDAAPSIRMRARYISPKAGGNTAVRDVIEKVLSLQGKWPDQKELPG